MGILILRRSSSVAIGIPEHTGHLGGVAAGIFVPGRIVCGCGFVAVCISIIDHRLVDDFCRVAQSRGIVPFGFVVVAYRCGSAGFSGNVQLLSLSFSVHQLLVGIRIQGLAFLGGLSIRYIPEGISVGADGSIMLTLVLGPFRCSLVPYSQIAFSIISRTAPIAQIDRNVIRRQSSRRQSQPQRQGQSQDIYPPGVYFSGWNVPFRGSGRFPIPPPSCSALCSR